MDFIHVEGEKKRDIKLFALSTCGWCKMTKAFLDNLGIAYDYIFVDLLEGVDRAEAISEVEKWNPARSFPTIVIDGKKCVVGFKENEIKKVLE